VRQLSAHKIKGYVGVAWRIVYLDRWPHNMSALDHFLPVGSKGFRFWRKTGEITKTGRHDENIDFWWNSWFVAKFLTKFALSDER